MQYVGLDVHARRSSLCILDSDGKTVNQFEVVGPWPQLLAEVERSVPRPFAVCYEASLGYGHLHELLAKRAERVEVAHPGHLRLIFGGKRKNNRVDAAKLAKLLYLDAVPKVHVPERQVRQWRGLIEFRRRLMEKRVAVKNGLRAILRSCGVGHEAPRGAGLWTNKGVAWLRSVELGGGEADALRRDMLVEDLERYTDRIKQVERALDKIAAQQPAVALLRTIPGVGPRTAEAFVAYVDDVRRFARVRQVGAYFGLVPCQDASGDKDRLGHITRDGPATVRQLLCEAAWQAVRRSPRLRAFFERVMRDDVQRKKIALVATAHHLARVMTAMLRSGEVWRPEEDNAKAKAEDNAKAEGDRQDRDAAAGAAAAPLRKTPHA